MFLLNVLLLAVFFKHDETVERYLFKISVSSTDVWIAPALNCRNEIGMCIGFRPLDLNITKVNYKVKCWRNGSENYADGS